MGGQNHWERQRREIDACNVLYSAFTGRNGGRTLKDLGFNQPFRFPEIPIRRRSKAAEPDFAVFNGSTLFLIEVKSGKNTSERHIDQMERCYAVTIEDARNYLKEAEVSKYGLDKDSLDTVESCIVYMENRFHEHIDISPNQKTLNSITSHCPILTQARDGQLRIERGEFSEKNLDSFLSSGVPLPKIPPQAIFLNEEAEKESLAVSICLDHVMRDLKNGRVTLDESKVEDLYPTRALDYRDISDVLDFLNQIGACREEGNNGYVFEQGHQRNIFRVKDFVAKKRVDDYLDNPEHSQALLDEFEKD